MIEENYIIQLSSYLRNFKKIAPQKYRFSCNICGDSKKTKSMARGNFFVWKGEWLFKCYNCGQSHSFGTYLKLYFSELYDNYIFDKFGYKKRKKKESEVEIKTPKPEFKRLILSGDDIIHLNSDLTHPASVYLLNRGLTEEMVNELYYTDNFKKYVNDTLIPKKFKHVDDPDPRIVIPFFSIDGKVIGMQGRSLDPNNPVRYITIKLISETEPLLWGLDRIDQSKNVFVLEGPIDAMFIKNAVAWAGGSLDKINGVLFPILVWDNEPYNKDINRQIQKAINNGFRIVVWPKKNKEKDVNDMINAGINVDDVYLLENSYKGLEAQLQFDQWRKT